MSEIRFHLVWSDAKASLLVESVSNEELTEKDKKKIEDDEKLGLYHYIFNIEAKNVFNKFEFDLKKIKAQLFITAAQPSASQNPKNSYMPKHTHLRKKQVNKFYAHTVTIPYNVIDCSPKKGIEKIKQYQLLSGIKQITFETDGRTIKLFFQSDNDISIEDAFLLGFYFRQYSKTV